MSKKTHTPDLFLCHSNKDKDFVRQLARDLHDILIYAWFDEWELAPGDSLHDSIGKALEQTSYVAVIISPDSVESEWCKKELNQALSRETREGQKVVIPLRFKGVQIPAFLEDKLYLDFSISYYSSLCLLAAYIHGVNQRAITQAMVATPPADIAQVVAILKGAGWKNETLIPGDDWQTLLELLQKYDLDVRERFSIEDDQGHKRHLAK